MAGSGHKSEDPLREELGRGKGEWMMRRKAEGRGPTRCSRRPPAAKFSARGYIIAKTGSRETDGRWPGQKPVSHRDRSSCGPAAVASKKDGNRRSRGEDARRLCMRMSQRESLRLLNSCSSRIRPPRTGSLCGLTRIDDPAFARTRVNTSPYSQLPSRRANAN